ncbi:hypothetical protein BDW72DRAFT_174595 [Aspergillus terricola var. indicus]
MTSSLTLLEAPDEALVMPEVLRSGRVFDGFAFLPVIDGEMLNSRLFQQYPFAV